MHATTHTHPHTHTHCKQSKRQVSVMTPMHASTRPLPKPPTTPRAATPSHPHSAIAAAARTPMPTTRARQAYAHPHRCLRPGRPPAAAAPGGNPAMQASTRPRPHPARADTAHTPMHATRDRPTRARARQCTPPVASFCMGVSRRAPARHRTAPRPRAWHTDAMLVTS
jgi:hypothetical protein